LLDLRFDNRVPSLFDLDAGVGREGGRSPVEGASALGEGGKQVELGERGRDPLSLRNEWQ